MKHKTLHNVIHSSILRHGEPIKPTRFYPRKSSRLKSERVERMSWRGLWPTLPPAPDWLEQIIGSCKDEPAFEEVIALGRALRMAEPFPEDLGEGA